MRRTQSAVKSLIRSPRLSRLAQESAVRDLALPYFAGEHLEDAVAAAADLRRKGLWVSFAHLASEEAELDTAVELGRLLEALGDGAQDAELSVRPSDLGLRESTQLARETLTDLCVEAADAGTSVTLEMQGHAEYAETLALYRTVAAHHPNLGLTLPVDIRRAERDARDLARDAARVRICVGSYPAPAQVAYRSEHEKSLALVRCLRILLESGAYTMLATHDPRVINIAQELAHRNNRTPQDFEFQMLMGVRPLEQRRLVDIGLKCRTYIPFGPAWYEYLAVRIAARPRTLWSYARAVLDKR
ncbi:proline dehydrogenase family protein [Tessaracoccus sp. OS52]|uniref:proline dehydrogenase family protein n=1 Tax=Tessaracoccus sp. OS52 TaxID=2886691 RepID=UPI001D11E3D6|nr:proline dehydrogenase family protein [Tessaracoccus sp. OS52]MCC2594654.1 proline dehydrogenase family protein [Tessaracoccus sp. OS52]